MKPAVLSSLAPRSVSRHPIGPVCILLLTCVLCAGCGLIADKDLIVVAEFNGESITRGDLTQILRDMPDVERPLIQNKADLLRALNAYIDGEIKQEYAEQLEGEGKIKRERDLATMVYFQKYPDKRSFEQVKENYNPQQLRAFQDDIDYGIDAEEALILRSRALGYLINEAARNGTLVITDEEYKAEYDRETTLQPGYFKHFESVIFDAMRFDHDPASLREAGRIARRIFEDGEAFEAIIDSMEETRPERVMRAAQLQDDPESTRFGTFWEEISGTERGKVHGPILLLEHTTIRELPTGERVQQTVPDSFLVLKIIVHNAPKDKTLEEARQDLAPAISIRKLMARLRTTHGVEIYADKLPDPAGFGDQFKDSTIAIGG